MKYLLRYCSYLERDGHKEGVAIYYSPNVSMYRKAKSSELYVSLIYLYKARGIIFIFLQLILIR